MASQRPGAQASEALLTSWQALNAGNLPLAKHKAALSNNTRVDLIQGESLRAKESTVMTDDCDGLLWCWTLIRGCAVLRLGPYVL